jgi:outer membrane protein assembly factor BamB
MKSPMTHRKQTASFRIMGSLLTIAPLWLMMTAANTSAHAQTFDNVFNSSTAPVSSPADWTQFLRDNMQRWNPYETVLGVGNVGGLQLKWKIPTELNVTYFQSSAAVVNGVVYIGSGDFNVYALNASTGAKLWSYQSLGRVLDSPAVANGVVYFGSDDSNVYALNASTGAKLWSYATGGPVESSPAVANGVAYVGNRPGKIYALNAATGATLWSYTTGGSQLISSPAVTNGVVYVGSDDNNVYALNASTGTKLWSFTTGGYVASSPTVANGVVYIGSADGNVYALNANTGAKLWSYKTGFNVESPPAVANGIVYVESFDDNIYALNASTGAKLWSYNTGGEFGSSPAVANGVVYVGGGDGNIYALSASTGAKLWSYFLGVPYPGVALAEISSPAIVNGVVYISAAVQPPARGNIYAFTLGNADLFLRIWPSPTTVHQGDLLTFAFPVWNLGPANATFEVLNTQVPAGTTFDYIRISGTPGLGTCTHPPYQGTGQIVCHENSSMAPNSTWTVRLTVKVTAPTGTVITENAATMSNTPDPNMANNTATVSIKVQ